MNPHTHLILTVMIGIRTAILDGDIDRALKHTNAYYPSVLRDNENIYFKLRCRKFIEMIRQCNDLKQEYRAIIPTPPSKRSTASTLNNKDANRNSTGTDEYDFEMELDEQLGVHNGAPWEAAQEEHEDDEDDIEDKEAKHREMEENTIAYGQELQAEFLNDPRREVKKALEDTFALIAYENVSKSHLAPLLETSGRTPVAEELNGAILGTRRSVGGGVIWLTCAQSVWARAVRQRWNCWSSRRKRWSASWLKMVELVRSSTSDGTFCNDGCPGSVTHPSNRGVSV
jgi:hypothetical protein